MVDPVPINILTDNQSDKVRDMINTFASKNNLELEVSFRDLSYESFLRASEYYVGLIPDDQIDELVSSQNVLDISMELVNRSTYRISLFDTDTINRFIQRFSTNRPDELRRYLLSLKPSDTVEIIIKDRGHADRLVVDDYSLAFRLTPEIPTETKPDVTSIERIHYRYKTRYSFQLDRVRIDVTEVQSSPNVKSIMSRAPRYEIEIEATNKKLGFDQLLAYVTSALTVIQNSAVPISKTESSSVIQQYRDLLRAKTVTRLDARNATSMTKQALIDYIANRYAITDKADGDRRFLFLTAEGNYLMSLNMIITKTDLPIVPEKFHNTILDGEYMDIDTESIQRKAFLAFEVVYSQGIDYRTDNRYTLVNRINVVNTIVDQAFGNLIPLTDYTEKHTDLEPKAIRKFYEKELKIYWTKFTKALAKGSQLFVSRKLYFVPYGIDPSEVFLYADLVWRQLTYNNLAPYHLDGMIYTPINSSYLTSSKENKQNEGLQEYRWKPPSQNSIDFYIEFIKDAEGTEDAIYYDAAVVGTESSPYKICRLYCGLNREGHERPVNFRVDGQEQMANIYISDGQARDINGDTINDKTVVEFIFDTTKPDIADAYKWTPLRTRYDKTESIRLYRRKYGNYIGVANSIWKTIINPITEDNITSLADPASYSREIEIMRKSEEATATSSSVYYQKKTDTASGMRAFNNFIKSNLITTYCTGKQSVLDVGCGRGGDLRKFIFAGIGEYVGIDIDANGLFVISDSASNRYKSLSKSLRNVPPMHFIQADARAKFTVKAQTDVIPNMTAHNKRLINTLLSGQKQYDVINAQFTLHYYLSDAVSWSNFCTNINDHLALGGYMLVTCFDGALLADKLKGNKQLSIVYTDTNGNKVTFAEINKVYADSELGTSGFGLGIDLYNSMISEQQVREYLVMPDFLEESLKTNCGMELVETDSFFNLFNLYRNYFTDDNVERVSGKESSFYRSIRDFYSSLSSNKHSDIELDAARASFRFSMLNRYYVFKKTVSVNIDDPSRVVGINHRINLDRMLLPYFGSNRMVIDPARKSQDINKIYRGLIAHYGPVKPSVYLVKHTIRENSLDNMQIRRNNLAFAKIKGGSGAKTVIIYKSPDKTFYPIYYQHGSYGDFEDYLDNRATSKQQGLGRTYLLNSEKVGSDLDMLAELSGRIH